MARLLVSPSPHFQNKTTTDVLMKDVLIALAPATLVSVVFYGWYALLSLVVCVATCVGCEFLIEKYLRGRNIPSIWATVITGVLLALNLPPAAPWWVAFVGSIAAIGIAKMCFGGLGQNIFNPAIFGRVFLLISFPAAMTNWATNPKWLWIKADAFSGATPLALANEGHLQDISVGWQSLLGSVGGSMGEVSALALLIGFGYLLVRKVIKPHIPVAILGTVAVLTTIFSLADPGQYTGPVFNLLSGGLLLGAIFMATDYVTSPMTNLGMIIYGVLIGLLTVLIRYFGSYPEGVSFAILIANITVPLLNKYCKPKRFAA